MITDHDHGIMRVCAHTNTQCGLSHKGGRTVDHDTRNVVEYYTILVRDIMLTNVAMTAAICVMKCWSTGVNPLLWIMHHKGVMRRLRQIG